MRFSIIWPALAALVALLIVAWFYPAEAKSLNHHYMGLPCGMPRPDPACFADTPPVVTPVPPVQAPTPAPPGSLAAALQNIISGGITAIVNDLTSMDSVAGAVDPNSTNPAPNNVWNPYAHACAPVAIAWLSGLPSSGTVPTPTGPGGILTSIVVAGADLTATQDFINQISVKGIPTPLHMACDPFVMWILRQPAAIRAKVAGNLVDFMTLFQKQ